MSKMVKVAQTSDLSPGTGKVVQADGRDLALFNVEGTFFAIDNSCTHQGGPLGEGELSGDTVECPWHGAQFNVRTGAVTRPPAPAGVRSFPVTIQGDNVLVEVD
jgi:nitrite reductase/ring-hydroxylating ferredoxin subunit